MTPAAGPRRWMRIPLTVYFITTSLYCLLYFMPFTYVQLLESELVPALVAFERVHAWLLLPLVALADRGLQPALAGNARSRLRLGFRIVMGATGAGLLSPPASAAGKRSQCLRVEPGRAGAAVLDGHHRHHRGWRSTRLVGVG